MSFGLLAWDALPNGSRKHAFPVSVKMHLPVHNLWPLYRLIELIRLFPLKWLDGPCWAPVLLWPPEEDVLGLTVYMCCRSCCSYWVGWVLVHSRDCTGLTTSRSATGTSTDLLFRQRQRFHCKPCWVTEAVWACCPKWKFIVPLSPWFGGWWERLIRSIKTDLRKTVGARCLTRGELETTLHEVEACVNSRPLTFVSTAPDIENPLTPSHFLLGHGKGYYSRGPEPLPVASTQDLSPRYKLRKSVIDLFWASWLADYIRNLPPWKGSSGNCQVKIGSVVLVEDVNQPRLKWPLGLVTQVFPGRDGVVQTVEVKTVSGKFIRSVPRIHDLELMTGGSNDPVRAETISAPSTPLKTVDDNQNYYATPSAGATKPHVTSRGRVVKPVVRLDIWESNMCNLLVVVSYFWS